MTRLLILVGLGGFIAAATLYIAGPARAEPLSQVVTTIQNSGGRYVRAGASLSGSDCSGLVSVAQSLAMGVPIHRFGDTRSLLAGRWPYAIRGAVPEDRFVIGVNRSHMVAAIDGISIEASTSGQPYKIGPSAASPFDRRFTQFHIDPGVLTLA